MKNNQSITKVFSLLMIVTIVEKLLSFVFQALLADKLGANNVTDSYFSASEWFTLIDSTLLGALVVVLLKQYTVARDEKGVDGTSLLNNTMSISLPIMGVLSVLTFVFAKPLAYFIAPGFSQIARVSLIRCLRLLSFVPVLATITTVFQVPLRYNRKFILVSLKSLFISVVGILVVALFVNSKVDNADFICYAYIISIVLYALISFVFARKYNAISICRPKYNSDIKLIIKLLLPLMISNGIARLSLMVDRIISSTVGEGSVSCLTYSHTLVNFVTAFFITNLCTILLTDFTSLCSSKNYSEIQNKLKSIVSTMLLLLGPITVLVFVYSNEIVSLVFERGSFNSLLTGKVSGLLFFYAMEFIPAMIANIYIQVFYAFGDTKTPLINSTIIIATNIVLSLIAVHFVGLSGIAIGTSCSSIVQVVLYRISVKKYLIGYSGCIDFKFLSKLVPSLFICCIIAVFIKNFIPIGELAFVIGSLLSFLVFIFALVLLKEPIVLAFCKKIGLKKN